jgi:glutathione peroxidase
MQEESNKSKVKLARLISVIGISISTIFNTPNELPVFADEPIAQVSTPVAALRANFKSIKVPYNHENFPLSDFLGKATLVVNMKLDDPQTTSQFPALLEMYKKYSGEGLHVLIFPSEQGYFEPDDDETCRAKAKEYYGLGDEPRTVVFDKVDLLGPSANPLYTALTTTLPTPNGYGRITLNYEKFLLDANGEPLRRYPRKLTAFDFENDIAAALKGQQLPTEGPQYALYEKTWREAKREALKSEYAFRYNYNYYTAPDSMYKYKPEQDAV